MTNHTVFRPIGLQKAANDQLSKLTKRPCYEDHFPMHQVYFKAVKIYWPTKDFILAN